MADFQTDIDVLIVGAGPVGLLLANECARRGLRWRQVEEDAGQSEHSKALAIFPRTMEIFDMAGVAAPFLEKANRVTKVAVTAHGRRLAHMHFAPEESPYRFIAMVPQDVTEKLLAEELRRQGGAVEYETKFVSGVEEDGGVRAKLEKKGQTTEITASYVVGCDGAHSTVRHLLNLPFEGAQYADTFMLADIETNEGPAADELQLCPSELGPVALFPMSATRWRLVATIAGAEGDAPTLDTVRHILAERGPGGFEARELHWSSYFRIHHRQTAQLRSGRFFIAGDAAHIHSPFGGQGMNTGLQDVWNLVWKLDLAVRGQGNEALLESYSAERRPVIQSLIETTHMLTKAMGTPSRLAQTLRDSIIPMVSRLAPFQHAFVRKLSELGIGYEGSPIVEGAGERYWDDSMRGGNGIGRRFLLFVGNDAEAGVKTSAEEFCGSLSEILELRAKAGHEITLVRPDGYVGFAGRADRAALATARQVLEKQTSRREQNAA